MSRAVIVLTILFGACGSVSKTTEIETVREHDRWTTAALPERTARYDEVEVITRARTLTFTDATLARRGPDLVVMLDTDEVVIPLAEVVAVRGRRVTEQRREHTR